MKSSKRRFALIVIIILIAPVLLTCMAKFAASFLPQGSFLAWLLSGFHTDNVLAYCGAIIGVAFLFWEYQAEEGRREAERQQAEEDKQEAAKREQEKFKPNLGVECGRLDDDCMAIDIQIRNCGERAIRNLYYSEHPLISLLMPNSVVRFRISLRPEEVESADGLKTKCFYPSDFDEDGLGGKMLLMADDVFGNLWSLEYDNILDEPRLTAIYWER